MTSIHKALNDYLDGKRISKENYDDLVIVAEAVGHDQKILDCFCFLHKYEITGWRPKLVTQKLAKMFANSSKDNPIEFYSLFCPSYKKGSGEYGFRTDDVGNTSRWGIANLKVLVDKMSEFGIYTKPARAIFFDVALEQPDKTLSEIQDLKKNIGNFRKYIPEKIQFELLSEVFPFVFDIVGYRGIKISPLPVPQTTLERIITRGEKFYELFGWTREQIKERSEVIASSEAFVGNVIRHLMPDSVMVYTPTMLERAQLYSGHQYETNPLPIIFPKKDQ